VVRSLTSAPRLKGYAPSWWSPEKAFRPKRGHGTTLIWMRFTAPRVSRETPPSDPDRYLTASRTPAQTRQVEGSNRRGKATQEANDTRNARSELTGGNEESKHGARLGLGRIDISTPALREERVQEGQDRLYNMQVSANPPPCRHIPRSLPATGSIDAHLVVGSRWLPPSLVLDIDANLGLWLRCGTGSARSSATK